MRPPDLFYRMDEEDDDYPTAVECKFCGKGNLAWTKEGITWILYSIKTGEVHNCRKPVKLDLTKPIK